MDLQQFVLTIRENTDWLYTPMLNTQFFKLDLWSFAHFWSGMVIFAMLVAFRSKRPWLFTAVILALYEFVEAGIVVSAFRIFYPEKIFDSLTDMVVGMAGSLLMFAILKTDKSLKSRQLTEFWSPLLLASATLAFLWVGFYGYNYTTTVLNFVGINYYTFVCWFLSGTAIIGFYHIIWVKLSGKQYAAILITWLVYLPFLFIFEYIGFNICRIQECSTGTEPLMFSIIHGTLLLHFFYLSAPLFFVVLFLLIKLLLSHAVEKVN